MPSLPIGLTRWATHVDAQRSTASSPFLLNSPRLVKLLRHVALAVADFVILALVHPQRHQFQVGDHVVQFRHHGTWDNVIDRKMVTLVWPAQPAGASRQCLTSSPHRILVADEDSDLRQMYAEALAGLGYYIDAAQDGAAAWEALRDNRYHLLITEHEMPNLTGGELVKMRRSY